MAIRPFGQALSATATIYKSLLLSSSPIQSASCSLALCSIFLTKLQTQRTEKGQTNKQTTGAAAAAAATTTTTTSSSRGAEADDGHEDQERPAVLTVWRKSLLLSCSGFTVFDADGALAFRVDCYDGARRGLRGRRRRAGEVVLMDVAGTPLLTVRRRSRLTSLGLAPDRWLIFDGDSKAKPFLSVRRARLGLGLLGASSCRKAPLAYVTPLLHASGESGAAEAYVVEGSYGARACAVRDARGDAVAEVHRKERVGDDVFRLVAGPRLGAPLAMALVIALDEMFATAGSGSGSGSARRPSLLRRTLSA